MEIGGCDPDHSVAYGLSNAMRPRTDGRNRVLVLRKVPDNIEEPFALDQRLVFGQVVGRIVNQRSKQDGAAGCQRPARPSQMKRRGVAVADGLLTGGLGVDLIQRQGDLYELLAVVQPFSSGSLSVRLPTRQRPEKNHRWRVAPLHHPLHHRRQPLMERRLSSVEKEPFPVLPMRHIPTRSIDGHAQVSQIPAGQAPATSLNPDRFSQNSRGYPPSQFSTSRPVTLRK